MRKHGPLPGNRPNPAWLKRTAKRRRKKLLGQQARRRNRNGR